MKFNCNIYMRLYHISFFMPELFAENKSIEQQSQLDALLPYYEKEKLSNDLVAEMKISDFEKNLFIACLNVYKKLSPLLEPYVCDFPKRLQDAPKEFFNTIPKNISIEQSCYQMFKTSRATCYFYCKFTPCYYLFRYSVLIHLGKEQIPVLKYVKNDLYAYFSGCPVTEDCDINVYLEDLVTSLEKFLNKHPKASSNDLLLKDADKIIVDCLDINEYIARSSKTKNPITDNEKKRRSSISKSKKKASKNRTENIQKIIQEIKDMAKSKGLSISRCCQIYFKNNKPKLETLHITTFRTLQNLCSGSESNKQRASFSQEKYCFPEYSERFKKDIEDIVKNNSLSKPRLNEFLF